MSGQRHEQQAEPGENDWPARVPSGSWLPPAPAPASDFPSPTGNGRHANGDAVLAAVAAQGEQVARDAADGARISDAPTVTASRTEPAPAGASLPSAADVVLQRVDPAPANLAPANPTPDIQEPPSASAPEPTSGLAAATASGGTARSASDSLARAGQTRESPASLSLRLRRLPFGHPSSPYHVDGEPKAPPPRLKHLELAPPLPARATASTADFPTPQTSDSTGRTANVTDGTWVDIALRTPDAEDVPGLLATDRPWEHDPADLTEDQVQFAEEAYDQFRIAEGRDLFGGYGDDGLTVTLRRIEEQVGHGRLAPESERHALLDAEEYRARYADLIRRFPDRLAQPLAFRVPGALSYAFVLDNDLYAAGIWLLQDALQAAGFRLLARRNGWNAADNKCVVTLWQDGKSGLPFSVQFHTSASLEAQRLSRTSATLIGDERIPRAEAENLAADLSAAWAALPAPPGTGHISDYDGREAPRAAPAGARTRAPNAESPATVTDGPAGVAQPPRRNTP